MLHQLWGGADEGAWGVAASATSMHLHCRGFKLDCGAETNESEVNIN